MTDDECNLFIVEADVDGDGKINYEEFYNMMTIRPGQWFWPQMTSEVMNVINTKFYVLE